MKGSGSVFSFERIAMMGALSRMLLPVVALIAGIAAVSLHLGCNNSSSPAGPATVRGRLSFHGQPVAGALVVFSPDRDRGTSGKPIRCETAPDGIFELRLEGGIPAGWYRVAVAPPALSTAEHFPPQLRRPDTSTIVREVVPGKEHFFELAIEIPTRIAN